MIDLQLPEPLLEPEKWPAEGVFSIHSLKNGGAFARKRNGRFIVPTNFWALDVKDEQSLAVLLESEFENLPQEIELISVAQLGESEKEKWQALAERTGRSLKFLTELKLKSPTLLDWSRDVFPRTFAQAGELFWTRKMREYEAQLPRRTPTMDSLRFLSPFLRSQKLPFASLAAREWAYAQTLFSPQEDARGEGPTAFLNPTLQVVEADAKLGAIWRVDGSIAEKDLGWQEAAVIDELREQPRIAATNLLVEMNSKRFSMKQEMSFEHVIEEMTGHGLILRRP